MEKMNDLHVESYGAQEVETKKRSMVKRAAIVGGAISLTLSLFSLGGCPIIAGGAGSWFHSCLEDDECTDDECKYEKEEEHIKDE